MVIETRTNHAVFSTLSTGKYSGGLWFWGCKGQAALVVVVFVRHWAVFLWWDAIDLCMYVFIMQHCLSVSFVFV